MQSQDQRYWVQTETQEGPSEHQNSPFHSEGDLSQAIQGSGGILGHGDTQKPPGHSSGHVALFRWQSLTR